MAALNRTYVEGDLRQLLQGAAFYRRDAFAGLRVMDQLRTEREQGIEAEKEPVRAPRVAPAKPRGLGPGAARGVRAGLPDVATATCRWCPPRRSWARPGWSRASSSATWCRT